MADGASPASHGPLAVMLADHRAGREHVGAPPRIGAGSATDGRRARAFIPARRCVRADAAAAHPQGGPVLYPMACRRSRRAGSPSLATAFEDFERDVMGAGAHEGFHRAGRLAR